MTNEHGVAIDYRGDPAESTRFAYWGIWLGGVWSEETEGTNGIGTSITERRPITIHQSQHFRSRHIGLSCSGAPISDGRGELIGVLDISSFDASLSEQSHALAGALVVESARAIGERYFREQFRGQWIVAMGSPDAMSDTILLAVDEDRQIVGANHNARNLLPSIGAVSGGGVSLWSLFERNDDAFRGGDHADDNRVRMVPVGGSGSLPVLITPPAAPAAAWRSSEGKSLRRLPRLTVTTSAEQTATFAQSKGGLPPRVLRRVEEFIDLNLNQNIDLETLAATAGLSLHHFARAFRRSAHLPPHAYVLQKRIDLARDLLFRTDRPLADIALATGFADQSHFARQFRQSNGVSPSAFRRLHR